ncbi:hypothetical protein HYW44_02240 [Candidatus Daviesbacteria bacterium]|nr:hypothetical protein [Candidatus Daviesbacteria bacterium]
MQPEIIVSKNREARDQKIWQILEGFKIKSDNLDILVFDDEKIGIAQIKQLIKHLSLIKMPHRKFKVQSSKFKV